MAQEDETPEWMLRLNTIGVYTNGDNDLPPAYLAVTRQMDRFRPVRAHAGRRHRSASMSNRNKRATDFAPPSSTDSLYINPTSAAKHERE